MSNMYNNDGPYAHSRLEGTIVRLKGKPVYVTYVNNNCSVGGLYLKDEEEFEVKLDDLDLKPIPLGYINHVGVSSYMVRMPRRDDWRQGLRRRSMLALSGLPTGNIPNYALYKTVVGDYPSFKEARVIAKGSTSCAWCRAFDIDKYGHISHKGRLTVGHSDGVRPVLEDEFVYLQESLEETL